MTLEQITSICSTFLKSIGNFANTEVLRFYLDNKDWVELVKDIVYFYGAIVLIKYLWNRNYLRKTEEIDNNLRFRERIEKALSDYVIQKHQNGIKGIAIRFVHWKNYPWKFQNDGFPHSLKIEYHNDQILGSSWIDNTGIYFQEPLWFSSSSVYVDANGIFFFARQGGAYKSFAEHSDKCLVTHMPFTNIINFDFKEVIEYEPVFYIKYYYTSYNKLYSPHYIVRERLGHPYSSLELDRRNQLKTYSWIKYRFLQGIVLLRKIRGKP